MPLKNKTVIAHARLAVTYAQTLRRKILDIRLPSAQESEILLEATDLLVRLERILKEKEEQEPADLDSPTENP